MFGKVNRGFTKISGRLKTINKGENMNENERYAWLQLAFRPYVGAESFLSLLKYFGSAQAALAAPADTVAKLVCHKQAAAAWQQQDKRSRAQAAAEAALTWEQGEGCRLMLLGDADYPVMLGEGITPPPVLFLRGRAELMHRPGVAIVGSRHATPQAMRIARDFGAALSAAGITVVSGMAAGIDTAAHQGALTAAGGTVAVWGTGIDRIYPPSNQKLAYEIAERGLIVSEFPLDTRPLAGNFPRRNRIIAALSQAVLVVEAALESGSLITAKLAADIGREVLAVPGSIDNPHSKGCHKLIKEGAKLAESLEDILQECPQLLQNTPLPSYSIYKESAPTRQAAHRPSENNGAAASEPAAPPAKAASAADAWLAAMGYDPMHPDQLAEQLAAPAAEVYGRLLEWELEGMIAALPGGRYQRIA